MRMPSVLLAATALSLAGQAFAQDVIVMRRPITRPASGQTPQPTPTPAPTPEPTPAPTPTPQPVYGWVEGAWSWQTGAATCGSSVRRVRTVTCRDDAGRDAPDAQCQAPMPETEGLAERTDGCGYEWTTGTWSDEGACSNQSSGTREVACRRSDGVTVAQGCTGPAPSSSRSGERLEGCEIGWASGEWTTWSPICSANASRTRTVQCLTFVPGGTDVVLDDERCGEDRPATTEGPQAYYGNCEAQWQWAAWTQTTNCAKGMKGETRSAQCTGSDGIDASGGSCDPTARPQDEIRQASCIAQNEVQIGDLQTGQSVTSRNGRFQLQMRATGSLAIQDMVSGETTWRVTQSTPGFIGPDSPGSMLAAQADGNLVTYASAQNGGRALWNTVTHGVRGAYFVLTDAGQIVVHHPDGGIMYTTTGSSGADIRWDVRTGTFRP